jgi:hypothetical protein
MQTWPPDVPGYVHLMSVMHTGHETAYYCCAEDAHEITEFIAPHIDRVERALRAGTSLENIVDAIRREAKGPGPVPAGKT